MNEELRAALVGLRHKDLDDGPCWCSVEPNRMNGWAHVARCRAARAALSQPPEDGLETMLWALMKRGYRFVGPDGSDLPPNAVRGEYARLAAEGSDEGSKP